MNENCCASSRWLGLVVVTLGTFLIVAGLVWAMKHYTEPPPLGENRAEQRKKDSTEIQAAAVDALNNYGVVNPAKGIVRLPIARAMELTLAEYANPAAAKSNLVARVEKASAQAPPPPNPYE